MNRPSLAIPQNRTRMAPVIDLSVVIEPVSFGVVRVIVNVSIVPATDRGQPNRSLSQNCAPSRVVQPLMSWVRGFGE